MIEASVPSTEWRLSLAGIEAARHLANHLASFNPERLLSSPERKARETAEIIGERVGLAILVDFNLQEHKRTSTGYLSIEKFENGIASLFRVPEFSMFGEESADDVFDRFSLSVKTVGENKGPTVIVSHGTAISIYMSRIFSIDGFALWRSLTTPTAIVIKPDGWSSIPLEESEAR